jgi:hypothetical protein
MLLPPSIQNGQKTKLYTGMRRITMFRSTLTAYTTVKDKGKNVNFRCGAAQHCSRTGLLYSDP